MDPNYFTCTLGQAASLGIQQPHKTINEFVDAQAKSNPNAPAVGFPRPRADPKDEWDYLLFTFGDILAGSAQAAANLSKAFPDQLAQRQTVALLCPSTPEFLFTWLGLMRLGHAVLLIAPQCQPAAIASLCKSCEVKLLFYDNTHHELATEASGLAREQPESRLETANLPFPDHPDRDAFIPASQSEVPAAKVKETDIAYLHHTSGTSSGIPKPIPQTHRAGIGVLPSFPDGHTAATFTTTPLYHGGIADLFRAWTSSALIWLFPGKGVPITAAHIIKSLDIAHTAHEEASQTTTPPVQYFSSVPYVLQMLESTPRGLAYLQSMSIVGVGGAALPPEIGDRLVKTSGVNLISRFGSAECGFLLSSHRDFATDKEWQYLRPAGTSSLLAFEPAGDDGLAELVVRPGWPHMAKRNREDGGYATSDLFAPLEGGGGGGGGENGAWRYHSRADSQLTLVTGKKFDPAPVEAAIATAGECEGLVEDVLIFGNGRPYPGVLLFRRKEVESLGDEEVRERVWGVVERLNGEAQDHARVPRGMLVVMGVLDVPLEKSSKGTILRGAVEKRFEREIEGAYAGGEDGEEQVPDEELPQHIKQLVESVVHKKRALTETTDLFSYGVDSVAGVQIRHKLRRLLPSDAGQLPINVVEDCGNVDRLAQYVVRRRRGESEINGTEADASEHEYMRRLVNEYSHFHNPSTETTSTNGHTDAGEVIVLTGATGALGAHILSQYRARPSTTKIYCLVRGADAKAAHERVNKALLQRRLPPLDNANNSSSKIEILQAQLSDPHLGLNQHTYERVAREATVIMHVAWSVNFRMKLRSFVKDSIAGVTNLLNLALSSPEDRPPPRFAFCSSVASVMAYNKGGEGGVVVPERIIDDPASATELGYSKSKWVAEQICLRASETSRLRGRVRVFRVGQLAGDTVHGVWNAKEAWPMMLSAVKVTGSLPKLEGERLDWLAVDVAAGALIEGADEEGRDGGDGEAVRVFHVVNGNAETGWMDLLGWLEKEGERFEVVTPVRWVERLEAVAGRGENHPALQLLDHWKKAFTRHGGGGGGVNGEATGEGSAADALTFSMERTKEALPSLRNVRPVDEEYFRKLWSWIKSEM